MGTYFINEAFDKAIKDYIQSKDKKDGVLYNSFLVVLIRKLSIIYNELDIVIPFEKQDEKLFDANILKYGYSHNDLILFKNTIQLFYNNEKNNIVPNTEFILIEKMLINMFMLKKVNFEITLEEEKSFKELLYSPFSSNELIISYNYLHASDENEIISYFDEQNKINQKIISETPKHLLSPEAYKVVNKNYTDIYLLSAEDIEKINDEIYEKLEVKKNAINFEYLFDKALYNFFHKDDKISSGNGYVDILLILGIVCTIVMIILIISLFFI